VLSEDPERIRALVVVAGNPVLTFPNTPRVEAALRRLELLCASTSTGRTPARSRTTTCRPPRCTRRDVPLPDFKLRALPVHGVETEGGRAARAGTRRVEDLQGSGARRRGPFLNDPIVDALVRTLGCCGIDVPQELLFHHLLLGKGGLGRLKRRPGGIKLGEVEWGRLLESGLKTPDGRIALAPEEFVAALEEAVTAPPLPDDEFPFVLISGARRSGSYNTWTHNLPELMKTLGGNWATLHPADAARLGIADGSPVRISTCSGEMTIEMRISPDVREAWWWCSNSGGTTTTAARAPAVAGRASTSTWSTTIVTWTGSPACRSSTGVAVA